MKLPHIAENRTVSELLGLSNISLRTLDPAAFRQLILKTARNHLFIQHPDMGGDGGCFTELEKLYSELKSKDFLWDKLRDEINRDLPIESRLKEFTKKRREISKQVDSLKENRLRWNQVLVPTTPEQNVLLLAGSSISLIQEVWLPLSALRFLACDNNTAEAFRYAALRMDSTDAVGELDIKNARFPVYFRREIEIDSKGRYSTSALSLNTQGSVRSLLVVSSLAPIQAELLHEGISPEFRTLILQQEQESIRPMSGAELDWIRLDTPEDMQLVSKLVSVVINEEGRVGFLDLGVITEFRQTQTGEFYKVAVLPGLNDVFDTVPNRIGRLLEAYNTSQHQLFGGLFKLLPFTTEEWRRAIQDVSSHGENFQLKIADLALKPGGYERAIDLIEARLGLSLSKDLPHTCLALLRHFHESKKLVMSPAHMDLLKRVGSQSPELLENNLVIETLTRFFAVRAEAGKINLLIDWISALGGCDKIPDKTMLKLLETWLDTFPPCTIDKDLMPELIFSVLNNPCKYEQSMQSIMTLFEMLFFPSVSLKPEVIPNLMQKFAPGEAILYDALLSALGARKFVTSHSSTVIDQQLERSAMLAANLPPMLGPELDRFINEPAIASEVRLLFRRALSARANIEQLSKHAAAFRAQKHLRVAATEVLQNGSAGTDQARAILATF